MANEDVWNVQRLLAWTTEFLKNHGSASPRLEAEILLANALKTSRIELYTRFEEVPSAGPLAQFRDFVKRRGAGEPVAYLVGSKEFYSLPFCVSPAVLIPRPETEQLVLDALDFIKKNANTNEASTGEASTCEANTGESNASDKTVRVLDLGTGSGNIAIAIAKNAPTVQVTAVDLSDEALTMARSNADKNGVARQITFLKSDLFNELAGSDLFNIIVSNPPYVTRSEYNQLEPMVRNYEPEMALCGGENGTEVLQRIVEQAPAFLKPNGAIFLEASPVTIDPVVETMKNIPAWSAIRVTNDLARIKRYISARRTNEQ